MFGQLLIALLAGPLAVVKAQSSGSNLTVWAAVAYINHGETTPDLAGTAPVLTPAGGQQMLQQGTAFRSRYATTNSSSSSNSTESTQIPGLAVHAIDNSQLQALSRDTYFAMGAVAFMQGLYPPTQNSVVSLPGGSDMGENYVLGANSTDYPLNGYQYPDIETPSDSDAASLALQGDTSCDTWLMTVTQDATTNKDYIAREQNTSAFYQKLFSSGPLAGTVPLATATFDNAKEVYDFVNYEYTHNETVYKGLQDANNTLATLEANAFEAESFTSSHQSSNSSDPLTILYSMGGRTLADKVTDALWGTTTHDTAPRLTLLFGDFRPIMSFAAIAGLLTQENLASGPFSRLPEPGAALVFELLGPQSPVGSNTDDFKVRFLYRSSADDSASFQTYPLFGAGFGAPDAMSLSLFSDQMDNIEQSPAQWCTVCSPSALSGFCAMPTTADDGDSSSHSSSAVSPAVAGVIGALLMAVLISCGFAAAVVFCGLRFQRRAKKDAAEVPASGFKGDDRKASDADVAVSRAGTHHERVGSWELRHGDKDTSGPVGAGIVTSEFATRTRTMDDDGESVTGQAVNVRESV